MSADPRLTLLLDRARARARRLLVSEAALYGLAGLLIALPLAAALAHRWPLFARGLGLAALAAAAVAVAVFGVARARRRTGRDEALAALIAPGLDSAELRGGLLPAVELSRTLGDGEPTTFSGALARAHIEAVARAAEPGSTIPLERALPDRPVVRARRTLLAVLAVDLVLVLVFARPLGKGFAALVAAGGPSEAKAAEPVTGEIELTYRFPAYMRLPPKTLPGTTGEISAPAGTEVSIRTRADRDISKAVIEVGGATRPLAVDGRSLSGSFVVDKAGSWRFRYLDAFGRTLVVGPSIPIAIEADQPPKVELVAPDAELEVEAASRVALRYEAEDDYGLTELSLVYKLPGAAQEARLPLDPPDEGARRSASEYEWDLSGLGLSAGDRVAYYIEALDNDEISGKKTGVSRTQFLKLYSEAEHRKEALEKISEGWERLIALLADRLEAPERQSNSKPESVAAGAEVDRRAETLAQDFVQGALVLEKLKTPAPLRTALANIGEKLGQLARTTGEARKAAQAQGMRRLLVALDAEIAHEEQSILYLETLLDEQRIEDLLALSKELASKRRDLADLLERYRTAPDDATRERIFAELARLKERMGELMRRMAELSRGINDEHVNAEALKELNESGKMFDAFDSIQDLLNEGKVEDAMKEMESLGQMLDELQGKLQDASGEFRGGEFGELATQMQDFQESLDRVETDQRDIVEQMRKLREGAKQELEQKLKREGGEAFIEKLRKRTKEAREHVDQLGPPLFDPEVKAVAEKLEALDQALAVKDFDEALRSAQGAFRRANALLDTARSYMPSHPSGSPDDPLQKNLDHATKAVPPVAQVYHELADLLAPSKPLTPAEKKALEDLAGKQGQLREEARKLDQKMGEMNSKAPLFPPEAQQLMQGAGERMEQAGEGMRAQDPTKAGAEGRAALDQLGQLKEGLQRMGQQQGGQGQGKQPVPWPWMSAEQRQGGGPGGQQGSGSASGEEKVKVPKADQFKSSEEFRRDVLDAMKQASPERYREQVKKYYEEIVK